MLNCCSFYNVFLLLTFVGCVLPVGGRRQLNLVANSRNKCTVNDITTESVGDFCSGMDEDIQMFKTQIPDMRSSIAELTAALDELLESLRTTTTPTLSLPPSEIPTTSDPTRSPTFTTPTRDPSTSPAVQSNYVVEITIVSLFFM